MHYYSKRKDQPFICINCAAISRELLESELFGHEKGSFTGAVEQKKGKFGRILGTLSVSTKDGIVDANQVLINEQLAIPYTGGNKEESRTAAGVLDLWNTYYEHTTEG